VNLKNELDFLNQKADSVRSILLNLEN